MTFPIFGPIAIHPYGICIALGVIVALLLASRNNTWQKQINRDQLITLINISIIAGIVGGRILSILTEDEQIDSWTDAFALWDGGFSVLGSVLAITVSIGLYALIKKISIFAVLDIFGLYAPLVQAFGRIGCYLAGCCHGSPTELPWGITYTNPLSLAPLCIPLHPTQLYNVILLVILFVGMLIYANHKPYPGKLFAWSLGGISLIRFGTDFWRGDRGLLIPCGSLDLSMNQLISIIILLFAILILTFARYRERCRRHRESL